MRVSPLEGKGKGLAAREFSEHEREEAAVVPGPFCPVWCGFWDDLQWCLPVVPADRRRSHLEGHPSVCHYAVRLPSNARWSLLDHLPQFEEQAIPAERRA